MNRHERRAQAKPGTRKIASLLASGFECYQRGDLPGAEGAFRLVLRQEPENSEAIRLLGEVLIDLKRYEDAIVLLRCLTDLQPKLFIAHYTLASAYRIAGKLNAAIAAYRFAIDLNPHFAASHHGLGSVLQTAEREAEAIICYQQAVRLQPDWAVAWRDLGLALAITGDMSGAEAALQRAVTLQPSLGDAQRHLAAIRTDDPTREDIARLKSWVSDPRTAPADKIDLLFALGRLDDKAGQFDAAFKYFNAANMLLRAEQGKAGIRFDRERLTGDVDRLISAFAAQSFAERANWGSKSEAPVFIVGMPRAGSTLFEQVAAAHSQVFGAGEVSTIGKIATAMGWHPAAWNAPQVYTSAETYLASMSAKAGNASRIIDKMPDNIFKLGLIATMFPSARIVFCERDRRDVALSCYFQRFAQPLAYDTDLGDCAFRIREIDRLAAFWRETLPLRNMTLSYEAFLAQPETEARRLIDFMGLEWERACLQFHSQQRMVRTASWSQVRRPLYHMSAGRWRHYRAQLEAAMI